MCSVAKIYLYVHLNGGKHLKHRYIQSHRHNQNKMNSWSCSSDSLALIWKIALYPRPSVFHWFAMKMWMHSVPTSMTLTFVNWLSYAQDWLTQFLRCRAVRCDNHGGGTHLSHLLVDPPINPFLRYADTSGTHIFHKLTSDLGFSGFICTLSAI